jgi:hypothetical protein
MWKYRLEVTALRGAADTRTDELGWGIAAPYDALTFDDIGTRFGPAHPDTAAHPLPRRAADTSVNLFNRDNNLTIRASIVSGIVVLSAASMGGLIILSHLRRHPARRESDSDDL